MIKGILKKIVASTVAIAMAITIVPTINLKSVEAETRTVDYGAGKGVKWPDQTFAPFVDMCAWTSKPGYANNGVAYLPKLSQDTGIKFFNLGFIQSTGGTANGKVKWGWAGSPVLSEDSTDKWQYSGIIKSIKDLRDMGGDVTISLGGLTGTAFWEVTQDVDVLAATYKDIVEGYGLTRIDLDIEGGARDKTKNIANAKAIKKVQDETGVEVVLTVPVLPDGLTSLEMGLMDAYLSQGVDIKMVNIMAMCYGNATLLPGENYGTGSVRAIDSTAKQIQDCYKQFAKKDITMAEAYRKVGVTTSVGFEGSAHPIFTKEWTQLVVDHAIAKGIGMTSFWSLNRDSQLQDNQGIYAPYEHTKINMKFGSQEPGPGGDTNSKPVFTGVDNKTINVGQAFNNMDGVKATDKEDGDLTSKVTVTGSVNTAVTGNYTLTYSVTDSKGATTTATRVITVVKDTPVNNKPVINGATNKTINVGTAFDPKAGVTATDAEDGDLTSKIVISGSVNTSVAGNYQLTYSVTDSAGATTTATVTITVKDIPAKSEDVNGDGKVDAADLALVAAKYNVTIGDTGFDAKCDINSDGIIDLYDLTKVSKKIGSTDGGQTTQEWKVGVSYKVGDIVTYNGKKYKALIAHTSQADWAPATTLTVWQEV